MFMNFSQETGFNMPLITGCWSPFLYYTDLKKACEAIAIYTFGISAVCIAYCGSIMGGQESSEFYSPFFETDIQYSMLISGSLTIVYFLLYIVFAFLLIRGVRRDVLGLMLPWLWWSYILFLSLIAFSIWLLWSYYIFLWVVFAFLVVLLIDAWTLYLILVVRAEYQNIKKSQEVVVYLEPDPWYMF
ncbi:unnamed protein product [Cyprideis torosa]|uniref:Uncharacterized protein n=1 Tax=Cyprideis torosa TaxID=163714 RepID=A0A7R8WF95_9CRUS|nr:unnamed protein product [Cyprideis torosa]CAG0890669.1 unnamed protein product [Cyprideis torosa]